MPPGEKHLLLVGLVVVGTVGAGTLLLPSSLIDRLTDKKLFGAFRGRAYDKHGHHEATQAVTACSASGCPAWWIEQEKRWRHRSNELERSRLDYFEQLNGHANGGILPQSTLPANTKVNVLPPKKQKRFYELHNQYQEVLVAFDLWEPECASCRGGPQGARSRQGAAWLAALWAACLAI